MRKTILMVKGMLFSMMFLAASSIAIAGDNDAVGYPEGYLSHDGLVWRPNNIGPWGFYHLGQSTWPGANAACEQGDFEGKTGWRLPTIEELKSLYESGKFKQAEGWRASYTWSGTQGEPGKHYEIGLTYGSVTLPDDSSETPHVTCVRPLD